MPLEAIDPALQAEIQEFANHAALRARSQDDLIHGIQMYAEKLLGEPVIVRVEGTTLRIGLPVTGRPSG